ncbi:MAG: hypothetical protein WBZ36_11420 [Candidatus Nitrosopolaris sp.]|jgi:hypothetical protein
MDQQFAQMHLSAAKEQAGQHRIFNSGGKMGLCLDKPKGLVRGLILFIPQS